MYKLITLLFAISGGWTDGPGMLIRGIQTQIAQPWYESSLVVGSLIGMFLLACGVLISWVYNHWKESEPSPVQEPSERDLPVLEPGAEPVANGPDPIKEMINKHYTDPALTTDKLAALLNLSRSALYRNWNKRHRINISGYIQKLRLRQAIYLVEECDHTITEAAELSGFSSQSYFSKVFKKRYGTSPSVYLSDR